MGKKSKSNLEPKKPPKGFPKTFDEFYDLVVQILIKGNDGQVRKIWDLINNGDEPWPWVKVKIISETWNNSSAKSKQDFLEIAMKDHINKGNATELVELFTDNETGIQYKQFKFEDGSIQRVPIATEDMDKYVYEKASGKKFLGDYLEMHSIDRVKRYPLDTEDKVKLANEGNYFKKYKC